MGKVLRRNPPTLWRNGVENFPLRCMTYIFSCRKIFAFFIIGSTWAIRCSEEKVLNSISCWMYVNIDPISAPDTTCCLSLPPRLQYLGHGSDTGKGLIALRFPGKETWCSLELILAPMSCWGSAHSWWESISPTPRSWLYVGRHSASQGPGHMEKRQFLPFFFWVIQSWLMLPWKYFLEYFPKCIHREKIQLNVP